MLDDARMFMRFAWGLGRYLRHPLTSEDCRQLVAQQMAAREDSFLQLLQRGVFANPASPYRKLMQHVGVAFSDLARRLRKHGIEDTLRYLYEAGVYVTLDEFKGRKPIRRSGFDLPLRPRDFDNPLAARHYETQTGGSRGPRGRLIVDLDLLAHEAAHYSLFMGALGIAERPMAAWWPAPPGSAGMKNSLRRAKLGKPLERWFTQNKLELKRGMAKPWLFTKFATCGSRLLSRDLPAPEHVPLAQAAEIASWLAAKKQQGTPALLAVSPGAAIRVCLGANAHGLDIADSFFWLAGEPYTSARERIIAATGSRAATTYSMAETGLVGLPCSAPTAVDDVHLLRDKIAVIQQNKTVEGSDVEIGALYHTTLLTSTPKIMLNVESGDYGVMEDRHCGCPAQVLGFTQHLHTIRSYEKLTSEGMSFLGSDLMTLLEEVLPGRFGGHATDYQLVEEEEDGLAKVSVYVSPRVGAIDEPGLVSSLLQFLGGRRAAEKMMANLWQDGQTLRVVRREPLATSATKILPLHLLKD